MIYLFDVSSSSIQKKEAVSRDCLALHSKSLAILTFHTFFSSTTSNVELRILLSTCQSKFIVEKCQIRFCPAIHWLDSADCQKLTLSFRHVDVFCTIQRNTRTGCAKLHINPSCCKKNGGNLLRFYEFEIRAAKIDGWTQNHDEQNSNCLMVIRNRSKLRSCISCVTGYKIDDGRVIIDFSLTSASIVTDREPNSDCSAPCRSVYLFKENLCLQYVQEHTMYVQSNHRLLESPYIDPLVGSCMLFYHASSDKGKCAWCMEEILISKK